MTKRDVWKKYVAFKTYINKGDTEISFWQQFIDYTKGAVILTFLKLYFPQMTLMDGLWVIIFLSAFKVILKIIYALVYLKLGAWKVENEYSAKMAHLSPFNIELRDQLTEIANKVGARVTFQEL